jgi:hypothetical protein
MRRVAERDFGRGKRAVVQRFGWLAIVLSVLLLAGACLADDISEDEPAAAPVAVEKLAKPVDAKTQKVLDQLDLFCKKWMHFLEVREHDNRKAIQWTAGPGGVSGKFVGYSPDYDCQLRDKASPDAVPVATITYREFVYQQEGDSKDSAAETAPRVMEVTEVTEIFRYSQGKWVY